MRSDPAMRSDRRTAVSNKEDHTKIQVQPHLSKQENEELEKLCLKKVEWKEIPAALQAALGNSRKRWEEFTTRVSLSHQLAWRGQLVERLVPDSRAYYDRLMRHSSETYMLYPYHLQAVVHRGMRITPFRYYRDMLHEMMKLDLSYDSMPNFTATDCLRLVGVGRNQYIDTMNAVRAKGWLWRQQRNPILTLLPAEPALTMVLSHWWRLHLGVADEELAGAQLSRAEAAALEMVRVEGTVLAGELEHATAHTLYRRGLVYADVPVRPDDCIVMPPLESFVMNRVLGDYIERLLYRTFIAMDERTSVAELADILQTDLAVVRQAVAVYVRLGFARVKAALQYGAHAQLERPTSTGSKRRRVHWHASWENLVPTDALSRDAAESDLSGSRRVAFLFDSTITAYLMMGNLAAGLKRHAVTMFEVGKLPDESLPSFIAELELVDPISEGDAQRYVDHALCLLRTVVTLRRPLGGLDMIRWERMNSLDETTRSRLLDRHYAAVVSMAPLAHGSIVSAAPIPRHFGPPRPEFSSPWFRVFVYKLLGRGPPTLIFPMGARVHELPPSLLGFHSVALEGWHSEPAVVRTSSLLLSLNDLLLSSPAAVTAVSLRKTDVDADPERIPFPSADAAPERPDLRLLFDLLHLDTAAGYVELRRLEPGAESLISDVVFGVPLFDAPLNASVCDNLEARDLLSPAGVAQHEENTRSLCRQLDDFVAPLSVPSTDPGLAPLPTCPVVFDGAVLHIGASNLSS